MNSDLLEELRTLLSDYGINDRRRGRRFPDAVKSHILVLIKEGTSLPDIKRATGISITTLSTWMKKSKKSHFKKIEVTSKSAKPVRIFISDRAWIEVDRGELSRELLEFIRTAI